MEKIDERVLESAIEKLGVDHNVDKCIEEMSELIKALMKLKHNQRKERGRITAVVDELADVLITTSILIKIFDSEVVQRQVDYKMQRLSQILIEYNGKKNTEGQLVGDSTPD